MDITRDYLKIYIVIYRPANVSVGPDPDGADYYDPVLTPLSNRENLYDRARSYEEIYALLPNFRRQRVDSLDNPAVKRQSVMAFGLLIRGLEDLGFNVGDPSIWDKLRYETGEHGKPYFAGRRDINFSLSHTRGAAMCVMAGSDIGCDIESIKSRSSIYSVAKRILTPREIAFCMRTPTFGDDLEARELKRDMYGGSERSNAGTPFASPGRSNAGTSFASSGRNAAAASICIDLETFYHLWTRKEAYSKYTGEGLREIMSKFDVDGMGAYTHSESIGNYVWAYCMEKPKTVLPDVFTAQVG